MRQQIIMNIVGTKQISNLTELMKEVSRQGCRVNLSTLSRDISEIGIVKTTKGYTVLSGNEKSAEVLSSQVSTLKQMVKGMETISNFVVLHTTTGGAQAVARLIDLIPDSGLAGTIAGDDTIFGIAKNEANARSLIKRISSLIESKNV